MNPVPGYSAWLKADGTLWQNAGRTTPAVSDGDPVGGWDDSGSNGYNFGQSTSSQRGTLKLNQQNSLPAVLFDPANKQCLSIASLLGQGNSAFSLYVVCQVTSSSLTGIAVSVGQDNAPAGGYSLGNHAGGVAVLNNGTAWHDSGTAADENWDLLEAVFDGSTLTIFRNRTQLGSGISTSFTAPATSSLIGSDGSTSGEDFWQGYIGECLIYPTAHDSTDRSAVEAYLNARWNLWSATCPLKAIVVSKSIHPSVLE